MTPANPDRLPEEFLADVLAPAGAPRSAAPNADRIELRDLSDRVRRLEERLDRCRHHVEMTRVVPVQAGGQTFALPVDAIEWVLPGDAWERENSASVPTAALATLLNLGRSGDSPGQAALLIHAGAHQVVLIVDQANEVREVAVQPLGGLLRTTPGIAAATITDDGQVIPVLNMSELLASAQPVRCATE